MFKAPVHKKFVAIRTVGFVLSILYCLSAVSFILNMRDDAARPFTLLLVLLLAILFVCALAVNKKVEAARKGLVVGNLALCALLVYLYFKFDDLVPIPYILGSFIFGIYFQLSDVRLHFRSARRKWQSILVVDDDEILIKTVRPILMSHGYSVLTANKGEEGLRIAQEQGPDLILLDVILPGIKGREVCRRLKEDERTRHIPVIFLTAKDSQDDITAEIDAGGEAHLTKPVNAESLIVTIQGALER